MAIVSISQCPSASSGSILGFNRGSTTACENGGIDNIFVFRYSWVDWGAVFSNLLNYDPTTKTVKNLVFLGGNLPAEWQFGGQAGTDTAGWELDSATSSYTLSITATADGLSCDRDEALDSIKCKDDIVALVVGKNCHQRIFGVKVGTTGFSFDKGFVVTADTGTFGDTTNKSSQSVTLSATSASAKGVCALIESITTIND